MRTRGAGVKTIMVHFIVHLEYKFSHVEAEAGNRKYVEFESSDRLACTMKTQVGRAAKTSGFFLWPTGVAKIGMS